MKVTPSVFQKKIYNFVEHETGSGVVIAVAGSGKTTTIVEAANLIPMHATASFVAFNKAIATELSFRLPKHVRSQTLNAMGYAAWCRSCTRRPSVDSYKTRNIMEEVVPSTQYSMYSAALPRLVSLAKSIGIVPRDCQKVPTENGLTEDADYNWQELIDFYELSIGERGTPEQLIEYSREVLNRSIKVAWEVIDFDDQLYMPVVAQSNFFKNDFLFVDEAQDVNMVQRAMLRMALKPNGRLIAVGDPCQAIYGFRGADHNAIDNIKEEFSAVELPLSISYRCPRSVVALAQQYVPHILPHDAAPEGEVLHPTTWDIKQFQANDVVICRCTAPVITLAYKLIRARIPCFVMGREIGQGLVNIIDKMKANNIEELREKLDKYRLREAERLRRLKQDSKLDALEDRMNTIDLFIDELDENDRTIAALRNSISSLFSDNMQAQAVKLMTQHKSKGLEADRVFILDFFLNEKFMDKPGNQQRQETNLAYVAITRAKKQLTFITSKMMKKGGR